jgi:hypothetical protein
VSAAGGQLAAWCVCSAAALPPHARGTRCAACPDTPLPPLNHTRRQVQHHTQAHGAAGGEHPVAGLPLCAHRLPRGH